MSPLVQETLVGGPPAVRQVVMNTSTVLVDIIIATPRAQSNLLFPVNPLFESEVRHTILSVLGITGNMHACKD